MTATNVIATYGQEILAAVQAHPFDRQVLEFVRTHQAWAPTVVLVLAFAESLAVVGLFVPATFALVGIGALVATTDLEFWPVWLGATVGAGLGDWVSYWIGVRLENTAKHAWPLSRHPALYERGERFFRRWGTWSIFLGRFIGPVRSIVPLVAGVFEMPFVLFQAANWSSAMVWAFVLLAPGFSALKVLQH